MKIENHRDLIVFQKSFSADCNVFNVTKTFPREEMYSLTDQMRRSARSVSANIAEAWRKRRYEKHFCSTLNIAEAESAETQVWIEYAHEHGYLSEVTSKQLVARYDEIQRMLVAMINNCSKWCLAAPKNSHAREESESYVVIGTSEQPDIEQDLLLSRPVSTSPPPPISSTPASEREDA
ncbi:MAG: four helix bundle protein [Planctomycetota bacterium]